MAKTKGSDDVGGWDVHRELTRTSLDAARGQPYWWMGPVLACILGTLIYLVAAGAPPVAYGPLTVVALLAGLTSTKRPQKPRKRQ